MVMDFPVFRKVGEDIGEPVFVAQLAIVHQQHDRHRGELLGARRQAEIGVLVNFPPGTQISYAITALEHDASVLDDEHGAAGASIRLEPGEDLIDLFFWYGALRPANGQRGQAQQST